MLVKSAFTAALAATAHAFVIVPHVAPADSVFAEVAPLDPSLNRRLLALDCPGCPAPVPALDGAGAPAVETHLEMAFAVDASPDGDRLLVNGFELYPNPDPFTTPLTAPQVLKVVDEARSSGGRGGRKLHAGDQPLGYQVEVFSLARGLESQFIEVIGLNLQVIEVGGAFVDDIPLVKVLMGKKGDNLAIMDVKTSAPRPADPAAGCATLVCRLRAFVAKKLSGLKRPCPGRLANGPGGPHAGMGGMGHHKPGDFAKAQGGPPRPHHGHHHGHASRPARPSSSSVGPMTVITKFMFPALLVLTFGIVAGFVTMFAISTLLSLLIVAVRRRRGGQSADKASTAEVAVEDEEKAGLMEGQEPIDSPPSYSEETATPRS